MEEEISIPDGFEAVIEGNKIILKKVECDDERVKNRLIKLIKMSSEVGGFALHKWEANEMLAWLEKQGEQKPIINVPPREVILAIWDLGNEWKELTNGSISTEYGTQLDYIQKHWQESEYYLREKQGEQKSTDKIEPKFKVGDWVINKGHSYLIADIDFLDNRYLFEIGGYTHEQLNWEYIENVDKKYHLWTIQDAKDGDVLAVDNKPFIYNGSKNEVTVGAYCGFNTKYKFSFAYNYVINQNITPATKEQRDLLFQKMHEARYEWDADKKELKKIENASNNEAH